MRTSQVGISLIKSFESCRLKAYKPTANDLWTIGWGNTYIYGRKVIASDKITQSEADRIFLESLIEREQAVNNLGLNLNQNQFDALVSFVYNLGYRWISDKSALYLMLKADVNNQAIRSKFMEYNTQKGIVLNGLTNRRRQEADLYFQGLKKKAVGKFTPLVFFGWLSLV